MAGYSETINGLSGTGIVDGGSGTPVLTVGDDNASAAFSGVIRNTSTSTLALIKAGTGTQTISGVNTYTGATTVSAGTLRIGSGGVLASASAIAIGSSGTLNYAATGTVTMSNTLTGSGTLAVTGTKLILDGTGAAGFVGTTTVTAAAELSVNGQLGGLTNLSGLLTGTGTLTALTVQAGGNLSPADVGTAGTLTTTGTATWLTGGTYTWDVASIANASANDLFQVGAALDLRDLSSSKRFTININDLGLYAGSEWHSGDRPQQWTLATSATPILWNIDSSLGRNLFNVVAPANLVGGLWKPFYVTISGSSLLLHYVPEPGTLGLLLLGALALLGRRKKR